MRKTYIIDTSVLIYDPYCYQSFHGNNVVIPVNVLDELDKLKTFPGETGRNARVFIRTLDKLCKEGEVHQGIKIENDIILKIDTTSVNAENFGTPSYVDNKILGCAYNLIQHASSKKSQVILVSKDINLRIRARAFSLKAEDYEKDRILTSELYSGSREIINKALGEYLLDKIQVECKYYPELGDLRPNECLHIIDEDGRGLCLARKIQNKLKLIPNKNPWDLELRNKEQAFAVDLIMDPNVPLVSLVGTSGGGKTLVAMAAALELVMNKKAYNKLIVYRPIQPVGKEIGFLPGSEQEKLQPWMQSVTDSLDFLLNKSKKGQQGSWKDRLSPQYADKIELEAITYIRGRSIPNALIIVEEVQNSSREEIKTILTRVSSGTKIILNGDVEQIDNSYLDATNNGLTYVVEKFKDSELAGHITFTKGERSPLATLAANIL